ncbi:MAG: hypothetical protein ND866_01085 [Pyrinomonadaceae bacterium]|nr:hypothetical protein [Pyrinomonadaceae bacterium]
MTTSLVEKIADAVLYEGYILYPYRPSAVKNQQRWNFGALCPQSYSEAQAGTEAWTMQTECLIQASSNATLDAKVRFLHLVTRTVGRRIADCQLPIADCGHHEINSSNSTSHFSPVPSLEINGKLFQSWQEAVERELRLSDLKPGEPGALSCRQTFSFPQSETVEPLRDDDNGETVGIIVRSQQAIEGAIEFRISDFGFRIDHSASEPSNPNSEIRNLKFSQPLKITVRILNQTPLENASQRSRDEALMRSFVSTHTILNVRGGEFISLLDPPESLRRAAAGCSNVGTYPVLAGEEASRDCMLSSPIILYDYPQIAPESAGNLFDGTEIDEILTLRIMTLTDEEKREMCSADERARQILERTQSMPAEQLMKMHGAMKGVNRKS